MQILGWSASYPLQVYTVMSDIRVGTPALLDLIQHIGQIYLRARFTPIPLTTPITATSYMTFSPLSNVYHAPNTPGSYISTVACVADFIYYYDHITSTGNVRQYMLLALIYDFMAFSAQVYRTILRHRPPSLKQLLSARAALRAAIQQVRGTVRHGTEFANLIKIMLCIADTIVPNPYIPVPSDSLTFAFPLLYPRPSALVMLHPQHSHRRKTCLRPSSNAPG